MHSKNLIKTIFQGHTDVSAEHRYQTVSILLDAIGPSAIKTMLSNDSGCLVSSAVQIVCLGLCRAENNGRRTLGQKGFGGTYFSK